MKNKETECDDETSLWHWNQQQCHQKKPKVEGGKEKRVKTIRILFILFLLCFVWAFEKRAFEHTLFTWNEQKHTQNIHTHESDFVVNVCQVYYEMNF
jgi:hypothetical protein